MHDLCLTAFFREFDKHVNMLFPGKTICPNGAVISDAP